MTSNSQLKQKNIELKMQNSNLLDLRFALMSDNRRIEAERDNLRTHNDLLVQALDAATAERDEARAWARHYYWWSGFLSDLVSVWSKKWYADFRKKGGEE